MPAYEADIVAQRQDACADGVDKGRVVATGKVRAADRAGKDHISRMQEPGFRLKEDDVPR